MNSEPSFAALLSISVCYFGPSLGEGGSHEGMSHIYIYICTCVESFTFDALLCSQTWREIPVWFGDDQ